MEHNNPINTGIGGRKNVIVAAIIAFVIGFALSYVIFGIGGSNSGREASLSEERKGQVENQASENQTDITLSGENGDAETVSLSVPDQPAGDSVALDSVTTPTPVWVAVHEGATPDATWVLGARLVSTGTSDAVDINLLRGTSADTTYFIKLHLDDGDGEFELDDDIIMTDAEGGEIVASFKTSSEASQ